MMTSKWDEVLETAKEALKFRLKLWDHITNAILKPKVRSAKHLNFENYFSNLY